MITENNYRLHRDEIGSKAFRLFEMREHGLNVPALVCVKSTDELHDFLSYFEMDDLYSVRSSASCEDGSEHSFAGQFDTYLNVRGHDLEEYTEKCLSSHGSSADYLKGIRAKKSKVTVTAIIQRMIEAELSGVIFTSNPQGILNEAVIAVGEGTGNNVVEDKTDITHYYYNLSDDIYCFERQNSSPLLTDEQLGKLIDTAKKICSVYGRNQDIEFAIKDGEIYVLQSRPITSIKDDVTTVLDSSNISESYPGISLPMTISFVKEVYYRVFSSCVRRITHDDGTAERLDKSLRLMTDSVNGRVYYRISNWYDVIMLLPFSKKIIPVWQEMLGVSDKTVTHGSSAGFATKVKVTRSFFSLLYSNKDNMRKLDKEFKKIYSDYSKAIAAENDPDRLIVLYKGLTDTLADKWDLTLVNDMYTFIFTGLLKKRLSKRHGSAKGKELANQYISGNSDIESMKPVKLLSDIRQSLAAENALEALSSVETKEDMERLMQEHPTASKLVSKYIRLYGDRCPEELKLETLTYRLAPELLKDNILGAAAAGEIRNEPPKRSIFGIKRILAKNAAAGIRLRESSRISRGRIFALVRSIILKLGEGLFADGRIDSPRDVFYLRLDELFAAHKSTADLHILVKRRKERYEGYERLPLYSRLVFAGDPFDKILNNAAAEACMSKTALRGIPCSNGIAEGEIMKVERLTPELDAKGKIIAAKMTDPGWVFLITRAAGIISERGSLLSHTAIISRELGKPAVVGVRSLFSSLNDGDRVRINGATGEIQVLCTANSV